MTVPHNGGMPVSFYPLFRIFGLGFFVVVLSSCTTVPEREALPVPPPISSQIIDTLQAREAKVVTLKGLFQAEIDGKGMPFAQSLQGSILYQRPDQYRIKGYTRFGGLVFDFMVSKGFYALRVQDHPQPVIGGMDNFQRLGELRLPVLLSLRAIEVLLGKLSLPDDGLVAVEHGEDFYQFEIVPDARRSASTFTQRILINQGSLQVRQLEYVNPEGESVVSIQTSDYRLVREGTSLESDSILLPFTVAAEDRVEAGNITLEFQEIKANETLDERLFTVQGF